MRMTSITGHLQGYAFSEQIKKCRWNSMDPYRLFAEPLFKTVDSEKAPLETQLVREAANANLLMLWLDCDREGENIAYEVIEVCLRANPNLQVLRAHFSALTYEDCTRAICTLTAPNKLLSDAVEVRQIIDLRSGAAFTRFQTVLYQRSNLEFFDGKIVSFGTCQFPTLGFIVDRYMERKTFVQEDFYYVECIFHSLLDSGIKTPCRWDRSNIFDANVANALYEKMLTENDNLALVAKKESSVSKRLRPYPLNTVELQKLGSKKLNISAARLMEIAEKLYQKGFISYPRTETNSYLESIDLRSIIQSLQPANAYSNYAGRVLGGELWGGPRKGKLNDNAHPPIHPVRLCTSFESNEEEKVYDLICRHFLGSIGKDAVGEDNIINLKVGQESFTLKGFAMKKKNFLEIYTFQTVYENTIPDFELNQYVGISGSTVKAGKTTAPELLTESDLIGLMDKNGIGTDATIHEHIKKVTERKFVQLEGKRFAPTKLGLSLVIGYKLMGAEIDLTSPYLRKWMEEEMKKVELGTASKSDTLELITTRLSGIYRRITRQSRYLTNSFQRLNANEDEFLRNIRFDQGEAPDNEISGLFDGEGVYVYKCRNCSLSNAQLNSTCKYKDVNGTKMICCEQDHVMWFPRFVRAAEVTETRCEVCNRGTIGNQGIQGNQVNPVYKLKLDMDVMLCTDELQLRYRIGDKKFCLNGCDSDMINNGFVMKRRGGGARGTNTGHPGGPGGPNHGHGGGHGPGGSGPNNGNGHGSGTANRFQSGNAWSSNVNSNVTRGSVNMQTCNICGSNEHSYANCPAYTSSQIGPHANNSSRQPSSNMDNHSTPVCYKCNQPGHFSNNCPQLRDNNRRSNSFDNVTYPEKGKNKPKNMKKPNSKAKAKKATKNTKITKTNTVSESNGEQRCYICNQPGHFANNCPQKQSGNLHNTTTNVQNSQPTNPTNGVCYKCNYPGHYANNCPGNIQSQNVNNQNKPKLNIDQVTCYVCNQKGHFANKCPNKKK